MGVSDLVSALADAFHEAALEPELWPSVLSQLGDALGSASVLLAATTSANGLKLLEAARFDPAKFAAFAAEHGSPTANVYTRRLQEMRPGELLWRKSEIPDPIWIADPVYRDFLRPQGLWDGFAAPLVQHTDGFAAIGVFRNASFEEGERKVFGGCLRDLHRAIKVALHLGTVQTRLSAATDALELIATGVVLLDRQGRVDYANAAARTILAQNDGLSVGSGGALRAGRAGDTAALTQLTAAAASAALRGRRNGAGEHCAETGGALNVPRPSGRRSLSVFVAPLRRTPASRGCVLLIITDPEQRPQLSASLIARLHGLSSAESRLISHLASEGELRGAATAMGISVNTAKTLLQRAFERTGTHRQAELLALVMRGPAGLVSRA